MGAAEGAAPSAPDGCDAAGQLLELAGRHGITDVELAAVAAGGIRACAALTS
ncbi:MAG: hypothetical protein WBA97_34905 [Actinophytocola sp.]|uniref:hypothetical protein n=1 Tax=Actinophytocola sp. TaxID=1872138 RepID=UPI003C71164C